MSVRRSGAFLLFLAGSYVANASNCVSISPLTTDSWCDANCNFATPHCPPDLCKCDGTPTTDDTPTHDDSPPAHDDTPAPTHDDTPASNDDAGWTDPKARMVGYYTNWGAYSEGVYEFTAEVASKLTHVNYAFATVSYSSEFDVWYVSPSDPWADVGSCIGTTNCYGVDPDCILIDSENHNYCGSATMPSVSVAPFLGGGDEMAACPSTCFNAGGSPTGRSPACIASLDTFSHTKADNYSAPVSVAACGHYNYLLRKVSSEHSHIQFLLSVGGWYDSSYFSAATSPQYRSSFVKSLVTYIVGMGFDGVDIDYEYPGFEHGGQPMPGQAKVGDPDNTVDCGKADCQRPERADDGKNFSAFLQELRTALKEQGANPHGKPYLLTIAAPAGGDKTAKLPLKDICDSLDWLNLMAYDMHVAGEALTNHQAPMYSTDSYSVDSAVQLYLDAGCPADKIVLGVPFYGRLFTNTDAGSNATLPGLQQPHVGPTANTCLMSVKGCVPTYKMLQGEVGWQTYWDEAAQASYGYNAGARQFVSFDTPRSLRNKVDYAAGKGLGGFMYWDIGADDDQNTLLKTVYDEVEKKFP